MQYIPFPNLGALTLNSQVATLSITNVIANLQKKCSKWPYGLKLSRCRAFLSFSGKLYDGKKKTQCRQNQHKITTMPKEKKTLKSDYERDQMLRMTLVAPLWKKNYSIREIRDEVKARLELPTLSTRTVWKDVQRLVKEYREFRLENTEEKVAQELARLDGVIREAWEMWEQSKTGYDKKQQKRKGIPKKDDATGALVTLYAEEKQEHVRGTGDPRYLDIILKAQEQRRKLLGLDKLEVNLTGNVGGTLEIKHTYTGVALPTSEDEAARQAGIRE